MKFKTRKKIAIFLESIKKHIREIQLIAVFIFLQMYSFAQTGIKTTSEVYTTFSKILPYINGLVTILVFIAGVRGIQKILRSDPEGKTDLLYAGLGAAGYVGLTNAIVLLN